MGEDSGHGEDWVDMEGGTAGGSLGRGGEAGRIKTMKSEELKVKKKSE